MSGQINIPIGADTSGFYRELKKAFEWARNEGQQVQYGGSFNRGNPNGGGVGNSLNSALNNRFPDPIRAGIHELGNGGFIRTFESQMHLAGAIAVKTQELFRNATLRGIRDWASKLSGGIRDIVSPLAGGAFAVAKLPFKMGSAMYSGMMPERRPRYNPQITIDPAKPSFPHIDLTNDTLYKKSPLGIGNLASYGIDKTTIAKNVLFKNIGGSGYQDLTLPTDNKINYHDSNSVARRGQLKYLHNAEGALERMREKLIPPISNLSPDNQWSGLGANRRSLVETPVPRSPSSGGGRGEAWRNLPRDSNGRWMPMGSGDSSPSAGGRGYQINANTVHITANSVYITASNVQQGNTPLPGRGRGGQGDVRDRTPSGSGAGWGLAENVRRQPNINRKTFIPVINPQVKPGSLGLVPIQPMAEVQKERGFKKVRNPLDFAANSIVDEIFNPKNKQPSMFQRMGAGLGRVAGNVANGGSRIMSGVGSVASAGMGAVGAALGIAGLGYAVMSMMAGIVSDLGEKYVQQATKQSDTIGATGGRIGGGGSWFVNEEVARANVARGRISGEKIYGKGNQISQYEMKYAASLGVGLSDLSSMLEHIRHAEGHALSIDKIRQRATALGYKNLKQNEYLQKESEYAKQRLEEGYSSNFGEIASVAKQIFGGLKVEGRLGTAERAVNAVQPRFGTNLLSDLILSREYQNQSPKNTNDMLRIAADVEQNKAKYFRDFMNTSDPQLRSMTAYQMQATGAWDAKTAYAVASYDPNKKGSVLPDISPSKADPIQAMTNFFAGMENRNQAMFLNGIGAKAYELSLSLQKQQMNLVKEHEKQFMASAEMVATMQKGLFKATAAIMKFTEDVIAGVDAYMKEQRPFWEKVKKFMKDYSDFSNNIDKSTGSSLLNGFKNGFVPFR